MANTDADLLEEITTNFDYDASEWREIQEEGSTDMRYVGGNPWSDKDRKAREDAGRPVIALDELGQYVNQIINDVRENPRGIEVTALGNGANDKTAQLRQGLMRQIEYRSNAQQAYTVMFENAVQRSYGFLRIRPQYTSARSFNQELLIEPMVNPNLVLVDADILKPDGSDMKHAFVYESWTQKAFTKAYPEATVTDFSSYLTSHATWIKEDRIQLAEYWKIQTTKKRLVEIPAPVMPGMPPAPPLALYDDELLAKYPEGYSGPIIQERDTDAKSVVQYLTNGVEILKTTQFPKVTTIPIVCCFGKVLYIDDGAGAKRKILSVVRLARDPYMLYCYYRACEAELVGMTPKFPYFVYEGQMSPDELLNLQKSLHEPIAVIQVRPMIDQAQGQVLGFPQRQPYEPPIQGLEIGAEACRRAIQAAMGSTPLPSAAQRRNEKSGVALKHIQDMTQLGNFHFVDHYEEAIKRTATILDDWIPAYYDAAQDVTIRTDANDAKRVRINDPSVTPQGKDDLAGTSATDGDHDITLSTGPSFDSEREAASDYANTLAQTPQFPLIADLVTKLKNLGPIGDEIADRQHKMLPPQLQDQPDGQPIDPQVHALQAQLQQLQQELQKANAGIPVAQLNAQKDIQIAQEGNATKLKIAELQAQSQGQITQAKIDSSAAEASIEAEAKVTAAAFDEKVGTAKILHDATQQTLDRAHEAGMAALDHAHTVQQAKHSADIQAAQTDQSQQHDADMAAQAAPQETDGAPS